MEADRSRIAGNNKARQIIKNSVDKVIESYISDELLYSWIEKNGDVTPQMVAKLIAEYVPQSAFTQNQLDFIQHDPAYCEIRFLEGDVKLKKDPYSTKGKVKKYE